MSVELNLGLPQAMQQAAAAYGNGEWQKAEQLLQAVLRADSNHYEALNLLGIVAAQMRRPAEATGYLARAVAARPDDTAAHMNYGFVLQHLGRLEEALGSYGRALAINPNNAEVLYNQANTLVQLRRYEEALERYGRALGIRPDYVEACYNRGATLELMNRLGEALDSFTHTVKMRPTFAEAHHKRGKCLYTLGRFDEALGSFSQALKFKPDYAEAFNHRGAALQELRRFEEALESFSRAVTLNPNHAEAHHNRANMLRELGRLEEALQGYGCALKINPNHVESHINQGATLQDLKRLDAALESYAHALRIDPSHAQVHYNRANILLELQRPEAAADGYLHALKIEPDFAEAYVNLGAAFQRLRRYAEALESYARALRLRPSLAEAHNNRGTTLHELKRFDEALDSLTLALTLKPDHAAAYNNRGDTLQALGRLEEALASYDRAFALWPDCEWLQGNRLYAKMELCDWSDFGTEVSRLRDAIRKGAKATLPSVLFGLIDSPSLQRRAAEFSVRGKYPISPMPPKAAASARIRVGYFSSDFHDHATARLMAELFERHDRSRFEILAFSFGADARDAMRTRLTAAFDQFLEVRDRSDIEIAHLSRQHGIDIAVDLKGFTDGARPGIFANRAAPIQVNYLGYPGTMGVPYMDYLIADPTLIPEESRQHYAEKIVYMPHSYQVNDRNRSIADTTLTRMELGLPAAGFVFCCFNNGYKITPDTFDGWMRILKQVDGSVLWLLESNATATGNLRRAAQSRGVEPQRLIFAPRMALAKHLARHRAADLFLDTLPCNAHTTSSDALWAGLPVLTCMGESFASRVSASLLNAMGLPGLVAPTQERYERAAIELARSPERLNALKDQLGRNRLSAPLFDTERFTRHLEAAYRMLHERRQKDLSPDHIHVAP